MKSALGIAVLLFSATALADREAPNFPSNPYWNPTSGSYVFTDTDRNVTGSKEYSCAHLIKQTGLPIRVVVVFSPQVDGYTPSPNYEYCQL